MKVQSIFYDSLKVKSAADVAELGLDKEPRCAGSRQKEVLEQTFLSSGKDTANPTENRGKFHFPHKFPASQGFFFNSRCLQCLLCAWINKVKLSV